MQTKIIAHRGNTKNHAENTLSAFIAALHSGADGIELDVHVTKDGELVVHHDYYLGNPDNGKGRIYEKTLAYVRSLEIDGNERIPTLEEVFRLIGNKLRYELELKGFTKEVVLRVIELAKKYDLAKKIEFTSPHAYVLSQIKGLEPTFVTGRFVAPRPDWMDKKLGQKIAINDALLGGCSVIHCPLDMIDEKFIKLAHNQRLLVHAADCDTEQALKAAFALQVDQISTNELERAVSMKNLYEHATKVV